MFRKIDDSKLVEMVNDGKETAFIAGMFGCSKAAVRMARSRLGISAETGARPCAINSDESSVNWNQGVSRIRLRGPIKNPEYIMPKTQLPDPIVERTNVKPLLITDPGTWLILSDIHVPHHDKMAIQSALDFVKGRKIDGLLLNGDIHDSGALSRHLKHSAPVRYKDEIDLGKKMLEHFSELFPKARKIYKAGNHEERFDIYVQQHAREFDGLYNLPDTLGLKDKGYEWVQDCRIIKLGRLGILHGHEYRGGGGGISPAVWLSRMARDCSLIGHFHRNSAHGEKTYDDYEETYWSIGCLCDLKPEWLPQNKWQHGFAIVEIGKDGRDFDVEAKRILPDGRVR